MSIRHATIWTCDRCSLAMETEQPADQPRGWSHAYVVRPPLADPKDHEKGVSKVLCGQCTDAVLGALTWVDRNVDEERAS